MRWLAVGVVALALCAGACAGRIKYNTAGGPVDGKVNVHIVPHTHDGTADGCARCGLGSGMLAFLNVVRGHTRCWWQTSAG